MNNQPPTAQSGPSDRAIAQAFRELDTCGQHSAEECAAYNKLFNRAREIEPSPGILGQGSYGGLAFPHDAIFSATTPPAGARDAVTEDMVDAAYEAFCNYPIKMGTDDEKVMIRVAISAAIGVSLTSKADGGDAVYQIRTEDGQGWIDETKAVYDWWDGSEDSPPRRILYTQPAAPGAGDDRVSLTHDELQAIKDAAYRDGYERRHLEVLAALA